MVLYGKNKVSFGKDNTFRSYFKEYVANIRIDEGLFCLRT